MEFHRNRNSEGCTTQPSRLFAPAAMVLALALAAFPASAAAPPATLPTWQVGQAVGYGTNLDLTALAATFLQAIRSNPSAYNLTAIQALEFTGSFDAWVYDVVTDKTTAYYVLSSNAATGLMIHFKANVTANNLPQPGTYTGTFSGGFCVPPRIPPTTRTVAATVDLTSLATSAGTTRYQVSDLAIHNATTNSAVMISAHIDAVGVPVPNLNMTSCRETVTYRSESFTFTANTQIQLRSLYQPALDVFNFPINDNETWWANSTATVGATIGGTIDLQGLSATDQKALFDNLTKAFQRVPGLAVTGIDHFPIDLAKITVTVGGANYLQNGVLQDQNRPVAQNLRARSSARTLSDGALHSVYLITPANYLCPTPLGYTSTTVAAVYSPDFPAAGAGMIVGYEVLVCSGGTDMPVFKLGNVPASQANGNVGKTESTYNPFPPAPSNAIADFFVASPYYGLIAIVVVVIALAGIFLRRRGRKPAMAPMAPPPSLEPPPSSPGP